MAKFDSKTFNPDAFAAYMSAIPNVKLNELRKSRAIARDARLAEVFKNKSQTGTVYATIPYYGLIGGEPQNYDGATDLTPESTTTYEQGVFTYGRMKAWTEADFSYDVTGGVDFMANVRQQVMEYWNKVDQDVMLAILNGIFSMNDTKYGKANQKFVANHTFDISQSGDTETTDDMKMNATTLNTAIQKACGDNKDKFSLIFIHSAVATNLENLNLLSYLKYTDASGITRNLSIADWNGKTVVIDDSMPVAEEGTTNKHSLYTSYVLGNGAIGFEEVGAKVPYEMDRNPLIRGGEDTLISRRRNAISIAGISYTKATQASNSPTNEELMKGTNWSLINDGTNAINDKAVPIARIISRG
ncbi:phage coat protein [Anaerofustis stercorihominis]|uniref:phage coat protein n=1 Tax=Anaerofustis stercorihominis TaxID=214853 RepID=UPI00399588DC